MNKPKQFYEAPEAETLVVRFEGEILNGSLRGSGGSQFDEEAAEITEGSSSVWW